MRMDDANVAMVADLSEKRLAELSEPYPSLATTTDYRQLLENPAIDAVVIATPVRTHHRLATDALLQGKHVLVEKPLAANSSECEDLISTAELVRRVLMVGHTFQYNPAVEKLREIVKSGELGRIYYADCARLNLGPIRRDVNAIWDLAPHDASILLYVLDTLPESVSARGGSFLFDQHDDIAQVELQFPGGIRADIRVSWLDPVKVRRVTVVGSHSTAIFNDLAPEPLRVFDKRAVLVGQDGRDEPGFQYHSGDVYVPEIQPAEPLRVQIGHFLDCIREGRQPLTNGRVGLEVVRVIEAADESRRRDSKRVWLRPAQNPQLTAVSSSGASWATAAAGR
jgi:predicted dehydrogenase